jgi:hypothetical protein
MSLLVSAGALFLIAHGLRREADTLLGRIKTKSKNITAMFFGLSFILNGWVLSASETLNGWFDYLLFSIWLFLVYGIAYAANDGLHSAKENKLKILSERRDIVRYYSSSGLLSLFVLWIIISIVDCLVG